MKKEMMMKEHITFVYLPASGRKLKKIIISKSKFTVISTAFGIMLLLLAYMLFDYISLKHRSFENLMLRAENTNLQRELSLFKTKIDKVEDTMNRINIFATKLRMITKLEDPDRLHRLAIGPLSKYDYNTMNEERDLSGSFELIPEQSPAEEDSSSLTSIDQKLRFLEKTSALQEQNLSQLQELLEDQKSLLRSLPSIHPIDGWITSGFGQRISPFTGLKVFHEGADIATRAGTIIAAPADGLVTFSGVKPGYGNSVVIDHGYGIVTKYGHNSVNFVKAGDKVYRGQRLATVGNTGRSTGPHLHYEVSVNGIGRNPLDYMLDE